MGSDASCGSVRSIPFSWPARVYWEDTDAGGVVYHASYLRFFERCRTEWLRSLGFAQEEYRQQHDQVFAIRSMQVDYLCAARLDDQLEVRVDEVRIGQASLDFKQSMLRVADRTQVATAELRAACLRASSFTPTKMPAVLRRMLVNN